MGDPQVNVRFATIMENGLMTGMIRGYPHDLGTSIRRAGCRARIAG